MIYRCITITLSAIALTGCMRRPSVNHTLNPEAHKDATRILEYLEVLSDAGDAWTLERAELYCIYSENIYASSNRSQDDANQHRDRLIKLRDSLPASTFAGENVVRRIIAYHLAKTSPISPVD